MLVVAHTDIGIKKSVNQDSLIVREAKLQDGSSVMFAAVCDGMGGLSNGEIAEKLGISVNSVRTLKQNAYKKLKGLLKEYFYFLFLLNFTSWS